MTDIPFVTEDQLQTARDMEEHVLQLPNTLVIFVGARVRAHQGESPTYVVTAGCPHSIDPTTCVTAVQLKLRRRWPAENINVLGFCGRSF